MGNLEWKGSIRLTHISKHSPAFNILQFPRPNNNQVRFQVLRVFSVPQVIICDTLEKPILFLDHIRHGDALGKAQMDELVWLGCIIIIIMMFTLGLLKLRLLFLCFFLKSCLRLRDRQEENGIDPWPD